MFSNSVKTITSSMVVLTMVVVLITSIIYSSPVDPTRLTFGQRMDEETVLLKKRQLGLDLPLKEQIILYLADISPVAFINNQRWEQLPYSGIVLMRFAKSNLVVKWPYLRESFQTGRSVSTILFSALPNTLFLALFSIIIAAFQGIVLGTLASLNRGSYWDDFILGFSTLGYSVPSYVSAMAFALLFAFYWRDVTGLNLQGSLWELDDFGNEIVVWKNILLPCLALSIRPVAVITQLMRNSMNEVGEKPFIKALRAKGISRFTLTTRHLVRNALNPVVTALSGWFASLLTGAFFVEYVFSYKGLGYTTINALLNFDIPVVLGAILLSASFFILINITIDFIYKFLDPRIV
ncbi:MAG: ABC transporter permease [Saprospiraceae bacterium]|nr:ABC transporter permease [Saprospiraceae bacterium]|tara:strand:- start:1309 stop:2358 length:1050 start_codon:yes stop_codon:yes gene_type:complete